MKRTSLLAPFLLTAALLAGCGKDKDKDATPDYDGTVTWTHNGQTYTSKASCYATVENLSPNKFIIGAAPDGDNSKALTLTLYNLDTKGTGTYDLVRGQSASDLPEAVMTLNVVNGQGALYNTLYGPNATNGTIVVTKYDKAAQKIEGTFSFTAGANTYTSATGTQSVSSGSFSFRKFF